MKRNFIRVLVFTCITLFYGLDGQCQVPVLLRVVRSEQHDTLGCNIVSEITSLIYKQITAGKTKLWDSPQKEVQITGVSLTEIEKSSKTSFIDQDIIYIYEYWAGAGKNLRSITSGFSFSAKTKLGEEVSFGYVDYRDIQDLVLSSTVKSNANGNFNTTLSYYISGKNFYYHILQFGETTIDNISKSEQVKAELTGGTGHFPVVSGSSSEIPQKLVAWRLDASDNTDGQKFINSRRFENAIQDFLLSNKEVFYNLGGDKFSTYVADQSKLRVSKVIVRELWKKVNKQIQYDPVAITIYVNDSALNEILYRDMMKLEITIGMKSWIDFIREKEFTLIIQKINNQEISRSESYIYLKGLQTSDWRKITELVKSY